MMRLVISTKYKYMIVTDRPMDKQMTGISKHVALHGVVQ